MLCCPDHLRSLMFASYRPLAGATRTPLLLLRESPCYGHGQRVLGWVRQTPLVLPTV